jgi:hypothetical protein
VLEGLVAHLLKILQHQQLNYLIDIKKFYTCQSEGAIEISDE